MKQILKDIATSLFIGFLLLLFYGLVHVYVISNMLGWVHRTFSWHWLFVIFAIMLLFIVSSILEKRHIVALRFISRPLYVASVIWMGIVFIACTVFVVGDAILLVLPSLSSYTLIINVVLSIVIFVLVSYAYYKGSTIFVKTIRIPFEPKVGAQKTVKNIAKAKVLSNNTRASYKSTSDQSTSYQSISQKDPLHIVQISDVHLGSINGEAFMNRIVQRIKKLPANMVVITGDLSDGSSPLTARMIASLNAIKVPIFFVSGNHDVHDGLERVYKAVETTPTRILKNESVQSCGVNVIGVEYSPKRSFLEEQLEIILKKKSYDSKKPSILLYHTPSNPSIIEKYAIDLQLSGHTHHGQIKPFHWLVQLEFSHWKGLTKKGASYMYVSPGTGTWGPPMRSGSSCEITHIIFEPNV